MLSSTPLTPSVHAESEMKKRKKKGKRQWSLSREGKGMEREENDFLLNEEEEFSRAEKRNMRVEENDGRWGKERGKKVFQV